MPWRRRVNRTRRSLCSETSRRLRPRNGRHLGCLGKALKTQGQSQEAGTVLEAAAAAST